MLAVMLRVFECTFVCLLITIFNDSDIVLSYILVSELSVSLKCLLYSANLLLDSILGSADCPPKTKHTQSTFIPVRDFQTL